MRPDTSPEDGPEDVMLVFGADGHLDDGTAHAFVDGALPDEDAARVVLHLEPCARCAALVAEARGLAAAAAGVVRRLDDGPGVVPARGPGSAAPAVGVRGRRVAVSRAGLRAAAAALLAAGVGGSAYLASRPAGDVARPTSARPASGAAASGAVASAVASAAASAAGGSAASPATPRAAAPSATAPEPRAFAAAPSVLRRRVERTETATDSAAAAPAAPAVSARVAPAPARRVANGIVVGEVRDASNRPLAATSVAVTGTSITATTDDSGRFVLRDVPAGTLTLRARRIGYGVGTTAVAVAGADTARAALRIGTQALALNQVIVPGSGAAALDEASFGAMRRSDRRVRRASVEPGGCYAVAPVVDTAPRTGTGRVRRRSGKRRAVALPALVHIGADGAVSAAGGLRGTWTRVGADTLRVVWTDPALPALVLGREGGEWAGTGQRLTPTATPCEEP